MVVEEYSNTMMYQLGLGRYPIVTLAEARTKALENARAVDQGRDPRDRSRIPTFEQAAEKVIRLHEPTWHAGSADPSAKVWRSSLERYVFAKLGRKPVSEITTADVLAVIVPIWHTKTATARRVKGRISSIMRWAIAQNYIENNPASDAVAAALPRDAETASSRPTSRGGRSSTAEGPRVGL